MSTKTYTELALSLRTWNGLVAVVHLSSFVALLDLSIVYFDKTARVRLWTDFGGVTVREQANIPLFYTLLPFPLITGLFHFFISIGDLDNYSRNVLQYGVNRMRWFEYAITNGLMSWSLTVYAGAGLVFLPIVAVLSNFLMQYFGYVHEMANHRRAIINRTLVYLLMGFVPWAVIWFVVLAYFFESTVDGGASVTQWLAILGSAVLSLTFVVPLVVRYDQRNSLDANYKMELAYILLSLTAKLWLDWVVTIGSLA